MIEILEDTFPIVSGVTQTKITCISYADKNFTYQLTTSRLKKLLEFHILLSFLWYIVAKGMLYDLLTIVFLSDTFPVVS